MLSVHQDMMHACMPCAGVALAGDVHTLSSSDMPGPHWQSPTAVNECCSHCVRYKACRHQRKHGQRVMRRDTTTHNTQCSRLTVLQVRRQHQTRAAGSLLTQLPKLAATNAAQPNRNASTDLHRPCCHSSKHFAGGLHPICSGHGMVCSRARSLPLPAYSHRHALQHRQNTATPSNTTPGWLTQ